ncbi:hypothetical protein THRCLA_06062 [Thraustotheca clavata]|uniref:FYVE-type domain-containing protein n=1 Tax=Thraustotheca clavata TaxID=74557 RepID=A0A1V9ZQM8_9STRA|nr:hypothetical protein THRCLA_06062 [Thraustotheca clavata]
MSRVSILNHGVDPSVVDRILRQEHFVNPNERFHCRGCSKPFTYFRRKRHCRLCGEIVCRPCLEKVRIEKPARSAPKRFSQHIDTKVCGDCFFMTFHGHKATYVQTERAIELQGSYGVDEKTNIYCPQATYQFNLTLQMPYVGYLDETKTSLEVYDEATGAMSFLDSLRSSSIASRHDDRFDIIVELARKSYNTSIAALTLVDPGDYMLNYEARVGWDIKRVLPTSSLCFPVLTTGKPRVILNAQNEGFHNHRFVSEAPFIQFYASVPFHSPTGDVIGTIFVADGVPRQHCELKALNDLARVAESIVKEPPN